jgi:hypothetical protein
MTDHVGGLCTDMLKRLEERQNYVSDKTPFHLSWKVNRHNLIIWGSQNPHKVVKHVRDSSQVNVFCAVSRTWVYGPFFFFGTAITGYVYLDMQEHFFVLQLVVNCDLATRWGPSPLPHGCDAVSEPRWIGRGD